MARGNRKSTIFHDDEDRWRFLRVLESAVVRYAVRILASCLMGNHYHLILETPRANLSQAMQFVNGVFAQRSNRRHVTTGHAFEGPFRSLVIQRESYLTRAARYVVRNPVRACLTETAGDWPWSSYRATAGLELAPRWLYVDWIRWAFRTDSLAEARQRYLTYVNSSTGQARLDLNAYVLGTNRFAARLVEDFRTGRLVRELPTDGTACRPPLSDLFDRGQTSPEIRDQIIYTARTTHGYDFAEIARFLGIDRSTASKAATRYQRTNPELDIRLA
jgi:REP element-mobilizing transposase RayT